MRCMSCLENVPRREFRLCHGCKAWYCRECYEDHKPCNCDLVLKKDDETDDIEDAEEEQVVDDSKPGVWIVKTNAGSKADFDFWSYVA